MQSGAENMATQARRSYQISYKPVNRIELSAQGKEFVSGYICTLFALMYSVRRAREAPKNVSAIDPASWPAALQCAAHRDRCDLRVSAVE